MGYYKNLMILRDEPQFEEIQAKGAEEVEEKSSDYSIDDEKFEADEKEESVKEIGPNALLDNFHEMKSLLLSVKNIKIPYQELMLKNGNLRMFLPKDKIKTVETENLGKLLDEKAYNKKYFEHFQEKRRQKSADMPFIRAIYANGYESDYWLEQTAENFNEDRKRYPYLDQIFAKCPKVDAGQLYDFASNMLTRGFSGIRKDEKLAFQNAKGMLKRTTEQVSILQGRKTASTKLIKSTLSKKLVEFNKLKQIAEEIAQRSNGVLSAKDLFKEFIIRNQQTLDVASERVWGIKTEQDLFLAAKNIGLKVENQTVEAAAFQQTVVKKTSSVQAKEVVSQPIQVAPIEKLAKAENEKHTQLIFDLFGDDASKIIPKPDKKANKGKGKE